MRADIAKFFDDVASCGQTKYLGELTQNQLYTNPSKKTDQNRFGDEVCQKAKTQQTKCQDKDTSHERNCGYLTDVLSAAN